MAMSWDAASADLSVRMSFQHVTGKASSCSDHVLTMVPVGAGCTCVSSDSAWSVCRAHQNSAAQPLQVQSNVLQPCDFFPFFSSSSSSSSSASNIIILFLLLLLLVCFAGCAGQPDISLAPYAANKKWTECFFLDGVRMCVAECDEAASYGFGYVAECTAANATGPVKWQLSHICTPSKQVAYGCAVNI